MLLKRDRVILVGTARSGTTWLGRMMSLAEGVSYVAEPDNLGDPFTGPGHPGYPPFPVLVPDARPPQWEALWDMTFAGRLPMAGIGVSAGRLLMGIPRGVRDPLLRTTAAVIARLPRNRKTVLVKSIFAHFSIDWIAHRYRPSIVVSQRGPLNVVSSWLMMGMPLFDLETRPEIQRLVHRLELPVPPTRESLAARTAWCIGMLNATLGEALDRNPEWVLVTHETICSDPPGQIRALFDSVGLPWSEGVQRAIAESNRDEADHAVSPVAIDALREGPVEKKEAAAVQDQLRRWRGRLEDTHRRANQEPDRWRSRLSPPELDEVRAVLAAFPRGGWVREPAARAAVATPTGGGRAAGG